MKTTSLSLVLGLLLVACGGTSQNGGSSGSSSSSTSTSGGGNGGTAGNGGSGGIGGEGGTGGSGGAGGAGGAACGACDFSCCGSTCSNVDNDILNCGTCGTKCPDPNPFCNMGKCDTPPCNGQLCGPAGLCCGANCCKPGELCCDVPGPVGNVLGCFAPNAAGTCPTGCKLCQCTSPTTPIATPVGETSIASLKEGDLVYSIHHGAIVAVPIRKTQRVPVQDHIVMQVELEGGRILEISLGHPTADGRLFSDLKAGEMLDGIRIVDARPVTYTHDATYDILPDSDTGTYFAAGALVGSTIAKPSTPLPQTAPFSKPD